MKVALIISYYFPPAGGSAVQRVLKFVKYLPQFGWNPVVLTAKPENYALTDDSLAAEVSADLPVYRISAPDPYALYSRLLGRKKQDVDMVSLTSDGVHSPLKRLAEWVRGAFFIPDARMGWYPAACREGLRAIRIHRPQVIFSTAPPFTTTCVGGYLKKRTGIPWVSDYRDPWTQAYFYLKRPAAAQFFEDRLERKLLSRADRVLAVNGQLLDDLADKYQLPGMDQRLVIPNGYDPEDFLSIRPVTDPFFNIVYTGTVNSKMHPGALFDVMPRFFERAPELAQQVRFKFIGRVSPDIQSLFDRPGIREYVTMHAHLPRAECLRHTAGADLLLLLIPEYAQNRLIVTNKLFEYMQAGKPILCLSDESEAARIVRKTGSGFAPNPVQSDQILEWLIGQVKAWKAGETNRLPDRHMHEIEQYSRIAHARKLAASFDEITAGSARHSGGTR